MTADVLAIILDVFSKTLNTEVGPGDDFFSLGGDSLSSEIVSTEISSRILMDLLGWILLDYARPIDLLAYITTRRLCAGRWRAKLPKSTKKLTAVNFFRTHDVAWGRTKAP